MINKNINRALDIINKYGFMVRTQPHTSWVLDQVLRALLGCPQVEKEGEYVTREKFKYVVEGTNDLYALFISYGDWDLGISPYENDRNETKKMSLGSGDI